MSLLSCLFNFFQFPIFAKKAVSKSSYTKLCILFSFCTSVNLFRLLSSNNFSGEESGVEQLIGFRLIFTIVSAVNGFCSTKRWTGSLGTLGACTLLVWRRLYFKGVVFGTWLPGSGLQDLVADRQYKLSNLSAVGLMLDSCSHVGSCSVHIHLYKNPLTPLTVLCSVTSLIS